VLLPVGVTEGDVEGMFAAIHAAVADIGAVVVGGLTEVTGVVDRPVVVGQMRGVAEDGRVVSTAGARPGDVVVQDGPVPVEGAAVLVTEATGRLRYLDPEVRWAAAAGMDDPGVSVVDAALAASDLGATAMHDATEGGLASGLHELAAAAGVGLQVDRSAVLWFEPGVEVCKALGADPWAVLASGALLATFAAHDAAAAVDELARRGHAVAAVGTVEVGRGVRDLEERPVPWPDRDEVARLLSR